MSRVCRRTVFVAFAVVSVFFWAQASPAWFTVPPGSGVTTVLDNQDNQFSWSNGPADQLEWLNNHGTSSSNRIKGYQDPFGMKFDLSSYKGQQVVAAELHLARSNTDLVTSLVASTINSDWQETNTCWRYKATPSTEWAFPHSDFSVATFGNYGSLSCFGFSATDTFKSYSYNGYTWIAMKIDPDLIYAMILDQPGGLLATDARWHTTYGLNPTVYTNNQNSSVQPRLFIQFATSTDTTAPAAVGALAAAAGTSNGEVVLSFTAPSDPDDAKAFGYNVRYSTGTNFSTATDIERWRIPRPKAPGSAQKVLIEGLTPGTAYNFWVQAYDKIGNATATPATVAFSVPAAVSTPTLANGGLATPDPTGKTVRTVGSSMRYFAATETAKINPATGNRFEDGYTGSGADDYKKANIVWDAGTNTISLIGCHNEMVGAQLILQRLGSTLSNVSVTVSDLTGPGGATINASPNIDLFQLHYVSSSSVYYPDAAIPLAAPFPTTFAIPDANHNPGGTYQSVWMDAYVPQGVTAGDYTGTVTVSATGMSTTTINLKLHVSSLTIPDYPTFIVDLNGYGNAWDFGSDYNATCLKYFQVCHKHRAVPNTLPYGWNGSPSGTDRCPTLTGAGSTMHASSWTTFDNKYGRFFTSNPATSAFTSSQGYTGPGVNTPITHFYTTFNEGWPEPIMDTTYGFDAAGQGPAYWDNLRATSAWTTLFPALPDLYLALTPGYKQANQNVISDWLQHAHNNSWTRTAFEIYLNEKYTYSGCHVFWVMEENEAADDFYADGYYHQMWRDGQAASGVTDVPWHFRIDISDRWGQHYGQLDNRINWQDLGAGAAGWHWPNKKYRQYMLDADKQEDWIWYGNGAAIAAGGMGNAQAFLQKWCQGFNGGLPYWDCYQTSWTTANDLSVVYSGQSVPGFGLYSGPVMSIRVKQMRQAQQVIELLNMWAATGGNVNRERVRDSVYARYGGATWDYAFASMDEVQLHKLHADLIAQLEPPSAPTVQFQLSSSSGSESVTSVNLAVTLSAASTNTVTVNYAVTGGTATGGGVDYTISGTQLTFSPGVTSQNVPITVVDDSLVEGNETIIVTLSSPVNATLGANTTHTYTINDNDAAPTFVAAGTVASGTGAITPALPSGLQANDILLLILETANEAISISNQNGGTWTQVTGSPQGTGTAGGSAATRLTAFWSRYNGTQGAPTTSDSGNHQLGRIIAIRGATTSGDPCNVTAGGVDATSNTSGSIPGATTTVANTLVVVAIATSLPDASGTANFSGWTNANLTGLTERTDNTVTAGNGGGLGIATGGKATAGAYGATAVTLASAAVKGMMSIAIKP